MIMPPCSVKYLCLLTSIVYLLLNKSYKSFLNISLIINAVFEPFKILISKYVLCWKHHPPAIIYWSKKTQSLYTRITLFHMRSLQMLLIGRLMSKFSKYIFELIKLKFQLIVLLWCFAWNVLFRFVP